jgi:phosphoglycerate dehydrogenase-like enzyme
VLTPHLGYVTRETYESWFEEMIDLIRGWRGEPSGPQVDGSG